MNDVITALNGSITPAPVNSELYRDFLNRKADDVITALNGSITPAPAGDELYRDFIERKFDDVIAGIGGYVPPVTFPTLTGSIVTFNSQYAGLPLKSHKIALTATQSGSGTPSPDNVRPISGYNAINISHSGADTSNPTVYTIQIGSTVYGGEYDARTGVFVVPSEGIDLGSLIWTYISDGLFRTPIISGMKTRYSPDWDCEIYSVTNTTDYSGWANKPNNTIGFLSTYGHFMVRDDRYTDANDLKTALNGVKLVYELATPTTIQLPPCPIDTLEGVNNIWANTGDTTLQYPKFG